MAENSGIEWTDHTFNPWIGCTKVSPACDHCYAEALVQRFGGDFTQRRLTSAANWRLPLKWERHARAAEAGWKAGVELHGSEEACIAAGFSKPRRPRVFCASLADVFDNQAPAEWRSDLFRLILDTPHLDWLLLTKRIGNVAPMLREIAGDLHLLADPAWTGQLPQNVWIGATVTCQAEADRDIPKLLAVPAARRFLSMEPLLGPVDLKDVLMPESGHGHHEFSPIITGNALKRANPLNPRIDWVIVGGESGPKARPMHPAWVRSLRDQCTAAGVPFLFKQHGEWLATAFCTDEQAEMPHRGLAYVRRDGTTHDGAGGVDFFGGDEETTRVGKKAAGRLLDGVTHDGFPGGAA
ncbi:phage Gp37/Gp68 family protein [Caldimonas tepidiphila]|uniref:phage Gp37/Gp68 family protein n=1 Tax=Caldimonas tepidiphila TaxID=2315841 RepID=UPI000E5A22A4|nr:phage Gp37/Gp68 family protein [Caldimonas tepidiphila]